MYQNGGFDGKTYPSFIPLFDRDVLTRYLALPPRWHGNGIYFDVFILAAAAWGLISWETR